MNRVERFLSQISNQVCNTVRDLPDKSQIDILSLLKRTFGQSKGVFINKDGDKVLIYDNGLRINSFTRTIWKYEEAMYDAISKEKDLFVDPSIYAMKNVGYIHIGILRRYAELDEELSSIDSKTVNGIKYKELVDSNNYIKRVYYIPKNKCLRLEAINQNIWIHTLEGSGNAQTFNCLIHNDRLSLHKGNSLSVRSVRKATDNIPYVLIANNEDVDLVVYVAFC